MVVKKLIKRVLDKIHIRKEFIILKLLTGKYIFLNQKLKKKNNNTNLQTIYDHNYIKEK